MRVVWAIPCRYAEVHEGTATIIGGGTNLFWVPQLPAPIGLMVAINIAGSEHELREPHTIRSQVLGPDMQPLGPAGEAILEMGLSEHRPPGWEGNLILPTVNQFVAPVEGTYTIEFTIDDRSETTVILVQQGPPPGTAPSA